MTDLSYAVKENAISIAALGMVMVQKGICTNEELEQTRVRASAIVDQMMAKVMEQMESDPESPLYKLRQLWEDLGLDDIEPFNL